MKTVCCGVCGNLDRERKVHVAAMDEYHEQFTREFRQLKDECVRLQQLLKDVVWYNFETVAREWKHPWPESFKGSFLELHAHRYSTVQSRGGRQCEKATYPYYYQGPVANAPPLPPTIVLHELQLAYEAVREAETRCAAPYEWAPGGRMYQQLLRESPGVKAYQELSSKLQSESSNVRSSETFKNGFRLQLGDPMEREATEDTQTTAKDILARVCGDRSLVCA